MIRTLATTAFAALAAAAVAAPAAAAPVMADGHMPAKKSAAEVLSDGSGPDTNSDDYDILVAAIGYIAAEKPDTDLAVAFDASMPATVFAPTDQAFRNLVADVFGVEIKDEAAIIEAIVANIDVDTLEAIVKYHVAPARVTAIDALLTQNKDINTLLEGATFQVSAPYGLAAVMILGADPDNNNPKVAEFNKNFAGNQIVHGIDNVMRPIDL